MTFDEDTGEVEKSPMEFLSQTFLTTPFTFCKYSLALSLSFSNFVKHIIMSEAGSEAGEAQEGPVLGVREITKSFSKD